MKFIPTVALSVTLHSRERSRKDPASLAGPSLPERPALRDRRKPEIAVTPEVTFLTHQAMISGS